MIRELARLLIHKIQRDKRHRSSVHTLPEKVEPQGKAGLVSGYDVIVCFFQRFQVCSNSQLIELVLSLKKVAEFQYYEVRFLTSQIINQSGSSG